MFWFSLALSIVVHLATAWWLLWHDARRYEISLLLRSGEEAVVLEIGAAVPAAPSPPLPDIPEQRFSEEKPVLPPVEKTPDREREMLPEPATSLMDGSVELLEKIPAEKISAEPVTKRTLTRTPRRRHSEVQEPLPETPEPEVLEAVRETLAPSEPAPASTAATAGADARLRGVRQRARPLAELVPAYPEHSRMYGEEGEVVVRARIDQLGQCVTASIEKSSGYPSLDQAALDTVRLAWFQPASEDGLSVSMEDRFLIEFRLR